MCYLSPFFTSSGLSFCLMRIVFLSLSGLVEICFPIALSPPSSGGTHTFPPCSLLLFHSLVSNAVLSSRGYIVLCKGQKCSSMFAHGQLISATP